MRHKWLQTAAFGVVAFALWTSSARAQSIEYGATSLGANQWRYDYVIDNSHPGPTFDEVTIYFDVASDTSLALAASPAGWDPLVIQPDPAIPGDGYLDVVDLGGAVPPGASVAGFSVTFTSLTAGGPGSQRFELYDSSSFDPRGSGLTTALGSTTTPVPEPETIALLLGGLLALGVRRSGTRHRPLRRPCDWRENGLFPSCFPLAVPPCGSG